LPSFPYFKDSILINSINYTINYIGEIKFIIAFHC